MRLLTMAVGFGLLVACSPASENGSEGFEAAVSPEPASAVDSDTAPAMDDLAIELDFADTDEFRFREAIQPLTREGAFEIATEGAGEFSRADRVVFSLEAEVTRISDGDSLSLRSPLGARFSIRMSDYDTPETAKREFTPPDCQCKTLAYRPGQPGGEEATDHLKTLLSVGDEVRADCYEADDYGRLVCHLIKGNTNINLEMIKSGWGWLPGRPEWVRDPESVPAAQAAEAAKLGAWGLDGQVSPRTWRVECWKNGNCEGSPSPAP